MTQIPEEKMALWRERAKQARAIAEEMRDDDSRLLMLSIAQSYTEMVEESEWELPSKRPK